MEQQTATPDWLNLVVSQPLGIAVLLLIVIAFVFGYIVSGKQFRREQDRADRLAETVNVQAASIAKAIDAAEKSLEATRLVQSLIQGIDSTLRNSTPRGQ